MIAAVNTRPLQSPVPAALAPGVDQDYRRIDAFIPALSQMAETNPQQWSTHILQMSQATRTSFVNSLKEVKEIPTANEVARQAVLAALQAGLLAGALDGVLVYTLKQNPFPELEKLVPAPARQGTQPELAALPDLGEIGKELRERLEEAWDEARELAETLGKEALHTGSGLAKAGGRKAIEWVDKLVEYRDKVPTEVYQAYLAQAFATGYLVSALDATLILKAGETPRN
jgi:hypothetical protein